MQPHAEAAEMQAARQLPDIRMKMNFAIFLIVLMMILTFGSGSVAGVSSTMGPNVNAVRPEEQKRIGKQDERNHGGVITEWDSSSGEKVEINQEEPSPKRKSRIKYRDLFECSC